MARCKQNLKFKVLLTTRTKRLCRAKAVRVKGLGIWLVHPGRAHLPSDLGQRVHGPLVLDLRQNLTSFRKLKAGGAEGVFGKKMLRSEASVGAGVRVLSVCLGRAGPWQDSVC